MKLTLNLLKCKFFVKKIKILEHQCESNRICLSENKLTMFQKYSVLTNSVKVLRFCHMLSFLKEYISEQADLSTIMKRAIAEKIREEIIDEKRRRTKTLTDFN